MQIASRFALLALCALIGVSGCGGGTSSGDSDPAGAVPRTASVYFEAAVRPEGSVREDALEAAGKLLQTPDPERRIEELVQKAFEGSEKPKLDFVRDVQPWLGEKAGFWLAPGRGGEEARGVAILASTDKDEAQTAIDRAIEGSGKTFDERSHGDVDYRSDADGAAVAVVDGFVLLGSEAELRQTIDALEGESLAEDDRYKEAIGELADGRLAHYYVDTKAILDQAVRESPEVRAQLEQARRVFPIDRLGTISGALTANGDQVAGDMVTSAEGGEVFKRFGALAGTGSTRLLGELPGDSWLALGSPKLGETLRTVYAQVAGAFGGAAIAQQLRSELGVDLQEDVFSWMGDVGVFARGTTENAIDGGVVISVTDSARATAAFGKLIGLARTRGGIDARPVQIAGADAAFQAREPGMPKPVVIARSSERVVIALGADAAADALSSGPKLSDGDSFGEARERLGDGFEPAFVLTMPAVLTLIESSHPGDAGFARAKPYHEAISLLSSGSKVDGERFRARFVAGLK
jgi:hypothetical protein